MDKQKQFLDKVYNTIVKETIIDKKNNLISFPWYNIRLEHLRVFFEGPNIWRDKEPDSIYYPFLNHCVDIYGLTDSETYSLWYNYKNMLRDIIENGEYLNESVVKQKNFFDKVLDRIVRDTKIDDSRITFPFANFKQPELSSDSLLFVSFWIDGRWENHKYPGRFKKYCNDIYGVTYEESVILWRRYIEIIEEEVSRRLKRPSSDFYNMDLNESHVDVLPYTRDIEFLKNFTKDLSEKQKGFLDKVVEHILRETDIDYEKWRINYPFFENTTYSFQYTLPYSGPFIRYCNNIFPLSNREMRYVHGMYTGIIHSKIRKYYVDNDIYNKYYNVTGTKDIINFDR